MRLRLSVRDRKLLLEKLIGTQDAWDKMQICHSQVSIMMYNLALSFSSLKKR